MPKKSLHTIVTMPSTGEGFEKNQIMKMFDSMMQRDGIMPQVSNAMAAVAGEDATRQYWRLWTIEKNPAVPVIKDDSGYVADDTVRYFFEYVSLTDTDPNSRIVLEYSRFDGFEIRGTYFTSAGINDLRVDNLKTTEAICAMLLAIMRHEQTNADYIAVLNNFRRDYSQMFSRGNITCYQALHAIYGYLCDAVDPRKESSVPGSFKAKQQMLNYSTGKLKRILDGENYGYVNSSDSTINIVGGMQATLVAASGEQPETVIAEPIVLMPIAHPAVASTLTNEITPKVYALRPDREYSDAEKSRLMTVPDWYIPVKDIFKIARAIHASSQFDRPYRNVLLRGPAGTGKTEGAKAIASMLGLPYGHVTGHAEMEFCATRSYTTFVASC